MMLSKALRQICVTTMAVMMTTSMAFAADMGQATGNAVNLRVKAGTDADVVAKINKGSEYTVLGISNNWFEISYEGKNAFVSGDYFELTKADGVVTAADVNIRKGASASAASMGKLAQGDNVVVTGQSGDWYQISHGGDTAYISKDFVTGDFLTGVSAVASGAVETAAQDLESTYGVVTTTSGLKLRKEASTISEVLTVLPYGTEVNVDRVGQEWIRVVTDGGQKGYVSAEFLNVRKGEKTSRSNNSAKGIEAVNYAKQFIGTPYVWGGTNLNSGVDCSGFVYAVFRDFGISLNRSSYSMAENGVAISKDEVQAGDLVFFNGGGDSRISHVGIYMGDGTYIHSTDGAAYGVTITSMSSDYSARTYVSARRVIR